MSIKEERFIEYPRRSADAWYTFGPREGDDIFYKYHFEATWHLARAWCRENLVQKDYITIRCERTVSFKSSAHATAFKLRWC